MSLAWIAHSKQKTNDIKMTPLELAKKCISLTPFIGGDTLMDGFRGGGNFFNNYPDNVTKLWCEIEEGRDFFKCEDEYDWFLTNPAFSLITPTITHACSNARKGIGMLIGCLNLTPKRLEMFSNYGFSLTHIHFASVTGWLGTCVYVVFERDKPSIITYDRTAYKMEGEEYKRFKKSSDIYQAQYRKNKRIARQNSIK